MSFCITPAATFTWDVQITRPGKTEPEILNVLFVRKGKDEAADWIERSKTIKDDVLLLEVMKGWDAKNEKGADVPLNKTTLRQLLNDFPAAGLEIFNAYLAALGESRAKN